MEKVTAKEQGGQPNTPYSGVNNRYPSLYAKWVKAEKAMPGLKFMDLLPHRKLDGKSPTMRTLNLLVKDRHCLIGIVTGVCRKQGCDFNHKLPTAPEDIATLCQIIDNGVKGLKIA